MPGDKNPDWFGVFYAFGSATVIVPTLCVGTPLGTLRVPPSKIKGGFFISFADASGRRPIV